MVRSGRHSLEGYGHDLRSRNKREEDRKNGVVRKTAMESALDWVAAHKAASAGRFSRYTVIDRSSRRRNRNASRNRDEFVIGRPGLIGAVIFL
jgi:hypothetical protein